MTETTLERNLRIIERNVALVAVNVGCILCNVLLLILIETGVLPHRAKWLLVPIVATWLIGWAVVLSHYRRHRLASCR